MRQVNIVIIISVAIVGYYLLFKWEQKFTNESWHAVEHIINTSKTNDSRYEFKNIDANYDMFFLDDGHFTGSVNLYIRYGKGKFTKVVFDLSGRWEENNGYLFIDLENMIVLSSIKLAPKMERLAKDYIGNLFRQTYKFSFYKSNLILTPTNVAGSVLVLSKTQR